MKRHLILALLLVAGSFEFSSEKSVGQTQPAFVLQWGTKGVGEGEFNQPVAIAIDQFNHVFVVDNGNRRIQKFDQEGHFLLQWGTLGRQAGEFGSPSAIAVDKLGNVYIADTLNHRIQKFDGNGNFLLQFGAKGSQAGEFNRPMGAAVDGVGNIYVADANNHRIQKFDSDGNFERMWGWGVIQAEDRFVICRATLLTGTSQCKAGVESLTANAENGQFPPDGPRQLAVDAIGNLYVADRQAGRIQVFDSNGSWLYKIGKSGKQDGFLLNPDAVAVDAIGTVFVADTFNHRIQAFILGIFQFSWGSQGDGVGAFNQPRGIAIGSDRQLYVADTLNNRIQKFSLVSN